MQPLRVCTEINYESIGLQDYGRAGNYFRRQIERWTRQYLADTQAGRDVHLDKLIEWLPAHIPPGDANIPGEAEQVAAYCGRAGREGIEHLDFYMAFNFFRFAAIIHGIKGRILRGSASSAQADDIVKWLPLALRADQLAAGRAGLRLCATRGLSRPARRR